jgi:hypothetical protein
MERFQSATGAFEPVAAMDLAPGHSATLLADGKVLLVSHTGPAGAWRPWAGRYDPATGAVKATAGQPGIAREGQAAVLLLDPPKVLLFGGRNEHGPVADVEWYDPATDAFQSESETMLAPRQDFGVAMLPNGELLVAGGSHDGRTASRSAERFDPVFRCFAPTAPLHQARRHPCLVPLTSGRVLVLGGSREPDEAVREVECYALGSPSEQPNPDYPSEELQGFEEPDQPESPRRKQYRLMGS